MRISREKVNHISKTIVTDLAKRDDFDYKTELNDDYYTSILGVRYLRKYFEDQVGFRVTFDEKIQFCDLHDEIEPFYLSNGLVNYEPKVMEIKFDPSIKDYVTNLVRKLNMTPKRHSKYLVGMAHLGNVVYI